MMTKPNKQIERKLERELARLTKKSIDPVNPYLQVAMWRNILIQPEPGKAIAYVDLSSGEFGIAVYLSGTRT
jgi:hypothetical protein